MEYIELSKLKKLTNNPRVIKDNQFKTLVKSIQDNPDYFEARPIICSDRTGELIIIAGNQRYEAARSLKLKSAPVHILSGLTEAREREIIIRDNVSNGSFDWDMLANEWDEEKLVEWGVDLPGFEDQADNNIYTDKIIAPTYEPKNKKPKINELFDTIKRDELIKEIENSKIDNESKKFLSLAAQRHVVFHYDMIADFYAHSKKDIQELMENSALIIIDFKKAIELGYVKLAQGVADQYDEDYGE